MDYKKILSFLFPPSEDERNIDKISDTDFIALSKIKSYSYVYTLLPYSNMHVRSAIHLLKFHNHPRAKQILSVVLEHYLDHITHASIIIPIPLSSKRLQQRGYNQVSEVLKKALSSSSRGVLYEKLLIRTRHTTAQTSLSREERLHNLNGAFTIKNLNRNIPIIEGKHLMLIDDVTTTGATLKVAKAALLPLKPASITCVALAH